jgi:hypothetical protein
MTTTASTSPTITVTGKASTPVSRGTVLIVLASVCFGTSGPLVKPGEGYRFLADHVILLNRSNPQIAARQLTPLTRWRKYDPARQELMKAELRRIMAEPNVSKDVYEVLSKSLQDA